MCQQKWPVCQPFTLQPSADCERSVKNFQEVPVPPLKVLQHVGVLDLQVLELLKKKKKAKFHKDKHLHGFM